MIDKEYTHHTRMLVPILGSLFELDVWAHYRYSRPIPEDRTDPASGGVEIARVEVVIDDQRQYVEWTDTMERILVEEIVEEQFSHLMTDLEYS